MAQAAARWEEVIVGDVQDIPAQPFANFDWFDGYFGRRYNEPVDDVVIGYAFRPKSFFSNSTETLGHAGAHYIRNFDKDRWAPPMTAISGTMEFNIHAIRESNYTDSDLKIILMHEMAHVLGIGGDFWHYNCVNNCFAWQGYSDNFQLEDDAYRCVNAQREYYKLGLKPTANRGEHLMVNHVGELGNVCTHWAGQSFRVPGVTSELMTPFFEAGVAQPLSTVTIGALADMGYKVNYDAADDFPKEALAPDWSWRRLKRGTSRRRRCHYHLAEKTEHSFDLSRLIDHTHDTPARVVVVPPWK